jgi:hypothetical protein
MASQDPRRTDAVEALRNVTLDEREIFRGVVPWPEDAGGWRRSSRETLPEPAERVVRRTVWDDPAGPDARLLVDVVECPSAREAVSALIDRLEWNELARLPQGPRDLGVASFVHPEGAPPAVFFARANLCVAVVSFARRPAPVLPVAGRLDRRLAAPPPTPPAAPRLPLVAAPAGAERREVVLSLGLPFPLAEDGYLRYVATGGTLEIRGGQVVVLPEAAAEAREVRVDVHVVEPGREPSSGSVVVPTR